MTCTLLRTQAGAVMVRLSNCPTDEDVHIKGRGTAPGEGVPVESATHPQMSRCWQLTCREGRLPAGQPVTTAGRRWL